MVRDAFRESDFVPVTLGPNIQDFSQPAEDMD
jgi:hypothetical protein